MKKIVFIINQYRACLKAHCLFLLFLIFLIFILTNKQINAAVEIYNGNPRTIAHDFLDFEKDLGTSTRHYEYINQLINKAAAKIEVKKNYTTLDAIKTLEAIHQLLKGEGFVYKQNFLLNKGLDSKRIDCDSYSTLYVAISEILRIPIIPVYAPNHSFIRFLFEDGSSLNWEPTEGKSYPDDFYIKRLNISKKSLDQGVYLQDLSRKEFMAVEYNNIGAYLLVSKKVIESIACFNMAITLYPAFSSAYHNRGSAHYAIRVRTDKALTDLTAAWLLDPNRTDTHNTLGDIYLERREYKQALDHYKESIRLDPNNYAPYYGMGLLMKQTGQTGAEDWFRKSEEIKEKYRN